MSDERTIECGFLCEYCHAPLADSPPLAEDWRVPMGRTVRLCPACEDKFYAQHIPANHRGDDQDTIGSVPCDCHLDNLDNIQRRTIEKLDNSIDAMKNIEAFSRLFKVK